MRKRNHITIARVSMLILVGLAIFAPMARAQSLDNAGTPAADQSQTEFNFMNEYTSPQNNTVAPGTGPLLNYDNSGGSAAAAPTSAAAAATPAASDYQSCIDEGYTDAACNAMTSGTPEVNAPTPKTGAASPSLWNMSFSDFIAYVFASIAWTALYIMSWWVSITGMLLNISITLTLHIKDFVNSTPGVYAVWQAIRDISSIFIIFMLLYASFMLILDMSEKTGGVGKMITNIVIGGILINFSFFITSILIDASNVVSLALYNGIVATPTATTGTGQTVNGQAVNCPPSTGGLDTCTIAANTMVSTNQGNLGSIFMNLLKPQSIYTPNNTPLTNKSTSAPLQILIQGAVGCVIMFTMGMSFLLASLAFVARLAILIVLLGFSPIWFAAMIFPILKEKAKHFTDQLYSQLVFMPIYLLLLYAAMTVLTKTTVFSAPSGNVFTGTGTGSFVPVNLIVLAINDFFILFLLNMPLVVAFSYGGAATDWLKGGVAKFGAANVWKNVGSWSGRNTLGRGASRFNESNVMRNIYANNPRLGFLASKGVSQISGAGFGGGKNAGFDQVRKGQIESRKKFVEGLGYDEKAVDAEMENVRGAYTKDTAGMSAKIMLLNQRAEGYMNMPFKSKDEGDELKKLAETDRKEAAELQKKVDERSDPEKLKKHFEKEKDKLKDTRKEAATVAFEKGRSVPAELIRAASGGKLFKGSNKFNNEVARAIQKKKDANDEIMAAIKEIKDKESGGEKKS